MAIDSKIRYTFLILLSLLLISGIGSFIVGVYFMQSTEARRNAVLSQGNVISLIVGAVVVTITSLVGFYGYLKPVQRKVALLAFCWMLVVVILACIFLGIGVWYQTLTFHDDSGVHWRSQWSYNLRRAFQDYDGTTPCCGFTDPTDFPAVSNICFDQSALPGCQDMVFSYGDSYLVQIYMFIFGMTFLDTFAFLAAVIFYQARNYEARFERMAQKKFTKKGVN